MAKAIVGMTMSLDGFVADGYGSAAGLRRASDFGFGHDPEPIQRIRRTGLQLPCQNAFKKPPTPPGRELESSIESDAGCGGRQRLAVDDLVVDDAQRQPHLDGNAMLAGVYLANVESDAPPAA